jgi:hypothetical protein
MIDIYGDMVAFVLVLAMIFVGRYLRGWLGGLFIMLGLVLLIWSGIDSAIKLFSTEWSFLERLYHFAWMWVGVGAALIFRSGWRRAKAMRELRDRGGA